ncbi:MAG TPA: (2Fe-2S) ferredoxin domain-containing protein [Oscillatoriales cyanobacterium M59_W2019_021]|nr:MAG: (2Fe-2S) ferredoxin domain-containing protein [Cyanobacteria bacterium J055]HIK32168.1 (2Fe-2S) ferredoxin domain-containing protein [Oscillatoriales cyanobacterium M4454_W2019_049]HIK51735.1 (2Fe-2S) ferredoxin domain-containing protein [Oscillatoriales cyanobacterium M59_W2019_021]
MANTQFDRPIVPPAKTVWVCQHRSCLAQGSAETLKAFQEAGVTGYTIEACDCQGQCSSGPTVRIGADETTEETWYCQVKPSDVGQIAERHLQLGEQVEEKLNSRIHLRFYF